MHSDEIPLYDYRVALSELIGENNDGAQQFTIDGLATRSEVHGDTATVSVTGSGHFGEEGRNSWEAAVKCATPSGYANVSSSSVAGESIETEHVCLTDEAIFPTGILLRGNPLGGNADGGGTPQVTVVQRNGRWYLSPVGTLLHQLDRSVADFDTRTLYQQLGLYNRIPVDGALTFGTPVTLKRASYGRAFVYTLVGEPGQQVIGHTGSSDDSDAVLHVGRCQAVRIRR